MGHAIDIRFGRVGDIMFGMGKQSPRHPAARQVFRWLCFALSLFFGVIMLSLSAVQTKYINSGIRRVWGDLTGQPVLRSFEVVVPEGVSLERDVPIPLYISYYPADAADKSLSYSVTERPSGSAVRFDQAKQTVTFTEDGDYEIFFYKSGDMSLNSTLRVTVDTFEAESILLPHSREFVFLDLEVPTKLDPPSSSPKARTNWAIPIAQATPTSRPSPRTAL